MPHFVPLRRRGRLHVHAHSGMYRVRMRWWRLRYDPVTACGKAIPERHVKYGNVADGVLCGRCWEIK